MQFLTTAETIKKNFVQELHDAADGKDTSLRFIKHTLPTKKIIKNEEIFQVLAVGGTIIQKALLKKDGNTLQILEYFSEKHAPLKDQEMLFKYLAGHISSKTSTVVINFAFPLTPFIRDNRMDGKLISATKAKNALSGLVGNPVGETAEEYFTKKLKRKVFVSILNDAICLLLSGIGYTPKESLAGAIIGTGTNSTFFYKDMAINIQSGGFNKFNLSNECRMINNRSPKPDSSLFEKEIAGAYLFEHFNLIISKKGISYPPLISTKEMAEIIKSNLSHPAIDLSPTQKSIIIEISRQLFEKSAAYFAAQITGLVEFKNKDVTIIIEGSMYWENEFYQTYVRDYLAMLSPKAYIKLIKVENSSIIGAAKLIA